MILNICLYSEGRLPVCFARGFGLQVGPFVILRDPNQNEIEVAVEKRNGKVYFVDGWAVLKNFYRILAGSWITVIFANRRFFLNSWDWVLFWVVIWVYLNFVMSLFSFVLLTHHKVLFVVGVLSWYQLRISNYLAPNMDEFLLYFSFVFWLPKWMSSGCSVLISIIHAHKLNIT